MPLDLSGAAALGDLPHHRATVSPASMWKSIEGIFQQNPELPGVIVLDREKLCGMISRQRFMELMNQPFRHDLYDKRQVVQVLGSGFAQPLCVAAGERIDVAAGWALERPGETIYEPVVIAFPSPGDYRLIDIQVLLRALSQRLAMQNDELRQARRRLIQSEKMALLGQLVAGVAHEINTPVGICLTAATHLQDIAGEIAVRYEAGTLTKSDLRNFLAAAGETAGLIFANSARAAELIQGFKQVAVDQTSQKRRRFNLGKTIRDTLLSLKPQLKNVTHEITVEGADAMEIDSYPGAISQILTNLLLNALTHAYGDAREHGRIAIRAGKNGDEVELTLADDGKGIAESDLKHIFEPFFSTRQGQGGSGLGLHIVYNLVTGSLGGRIRCESALGRGTRFVMAFPAQSPEPGGKDGN